MDTKYILADDGSFLIKDYQKQHPFSNFLPGIAGVWGVPIWVFYVNRGQGVVSFGIYNKDNSFAEFYPANKAYWLTPSVGFRTFLKINSNFYEPFRFDCAGANQEMRIKSASLEIAETNPEVGLEFNVRYFTLPQTSLGGLVRVLSIKNISSEPVSLDILDGLTRVIPFGARDLFLKHLARTIEAWMHSYLWDNLATFRLIVDPQDVSQTNYIEGAHYNHSFYERGGSKVYPDLIVDPQTLFGQDTTYATPIKFLKNDFVTPKKQITCGKTPCAFSYFKWQLAAGQEQVFYSVFGSSYKEDLIHKFVANLNSDFLKNKEKENEAIVEGIKNNAFSVSASAQFDHYIKCTYLDNVLRGGFPYTFDDKEPYYVFSRKHGDLERDYNKFKLLPSYFSEGEANYRDINQNRRMELFFNPSLGKKNITYFLNLVKIDGYNPLVVMGEKLLFKEEEARPLLKEFSINDKKVFSLMTSGFYLGELFKLLKEEGISVKNRAELAKRVVEGAERVPVASFGEGYWIDHWRYNLDLIENYLYFYPDKTKDLFLHRDYMFWDDENRVKERKLRYSLKDAKVYQWEGVEALEEKRKHIERRKKHFLKTKNGRVYKTHLVEKLLVFILNKSATLDPDGIGVEMEAGKPGWCDSLNGLPALLGSSLCETLEIKRACLLLLKGLEVLKKERVQNILLAEESATFLNRLQNLLRSYCSCSLNKRDYLWWDKANAVKEDFRKETFFEVRGAERKISIEKLELFLKDLITKLDSGIKKAIDKKSGAHFTYFTYEVKKYSLKKKHVYPLQFKRHPLPLFLEGPVHTLRVQKKYEEYHAVKESDLFDKKLGMYRLNASLKDEPLEVGRSRIFVPGWLENESVWLHMEYKYLLEVLKAGLYEEFFQDFSECCVCFFDPARYGRNILENSSFIVSSAYPDDSLWGKGFVARLSGATVELLNIWIYMCLGKTPFFLDSDNNLCMRFRPILKSDLFTKNKSTVTFKGKEIELSENTFSFALFSSVLVVYHNPKRKDTFSKDCKVEKIVIAAAKKKFTINSDTVSSPLAQAIRQKEIEKIDVYLH